LGTEASKGNGASTPVRFLIKTSVTIEQRRLPHRVYMGGGMKNGFGG